MKRREEGSIVEREKGRKYLIRWRVTDPLTGKSKRHKQIVKGDYVEAQSELSRKLRPEPEAEAKPERTFGDYVNKEWAQYVRDNWKGSTQFTHGSFVRVHIVPYFEKMLLPKIKPTNIVEFHTAMEEKGLSKKTRRNLHAILTKMFSYAADTLELIPKSPVKKGIAPRLDKHEKPALSGEQGWALWDALKGANVIRYRAFYGTLLFTGIRTGEALGLKWEDVDLAGRQITVKREIYRGKETTPKTPISLRTRPMTLELYTALVNHRAMAHHKLPTDYVFASASGRPINPDQLRENLQKVLRKKMHIHLGPRGWIAPATTHIRLAGFPGDRQRERSPSLAGPQFGADHNGHLRPLDGRITEGHGGIGIRSAYNALR